MFYHLIHEHTRPWILPSSGSAAKLKLHIQRCVLHPNESHSFSPAPEATSLVQGNHLERNSTVLKKGPLHEWSMRPHLPNVPHYESQPDHTGQIPQPACQVATVFSKGTNGSHSKWLAGKEGAALSKREHTTNTGLTTPVPGRDSSAVWISGWLDTLP